MNDIGSILLYKRMGCDVGLITQEIQVDFFGAKRLFKIVYADETNYTFHEIETDKKVTSDPLIFLFTNCWMGELINEEMIETLISKKTGDVFDYECIYQDDDKNIIVEFKPQYTITKIDFPNKNWLENN